jgi:uncharacterized protein
MRFLFEINHPGHFYLFRNAIDDLIGKGNEVFIFARNNEPIPALLKTRPAWQIKFVGKGGRNIFRQALKQIFFNTKAITFILKHKIDVCAGVSVTMPQSAFITGRKSIVFDDDDRSVTPFFAFLSHTFAKKVLSPDCLENKSHKKKYIYYKGYHELAYLHPEIFVPDNSILAGQRLSPEEPFFLLRFNDFHAHHDIGEHGLSPDQKKHLIEHLKKYGKVLISSEGKMIPEFMEYTIIVHPSKIHHLLSYASLYVGESQTMASESAVLGTPAIRINTFKGRLSTLNELEYKYELLYSYLPEEFDKAMARVDQLVKPGIRNAWLKKRNNMLRDKINVSQYISDYFSAFNELIKS